MALNRTKKSVVFHKGISDGADRFLLEPPAIDYAENLMFHKDGSLQKRPGFGPDELTTVSAATGEPFFLEKVGGQLVTLDSTSMFTYDEDVGWVPTALDGFLANSDLELETGPVSGANHVDAVPQLSDQIEGGLAGFTVVMEIREQTSTDDISYPTPTHVLIKQYNANGKLVNQKRVEDAHSPKVKSMGDVHAIVYFKRGQGLKLRRSFPFTKLILDEQDLGISPALATQLESHGQLSVLSSGRIGESYDYEAKYQMDAASSGFVVAWSDDSSPNSIYYSSFNTLGNSIISGHTIYSGETFHSAEVFDIKYGTPVPVGGSGETLYCVWAVFDNNDEDFAPGTTAEIWFAKMEMVPPSTLVEPHLIRRLSDRTHINGAVCENSDDPEEIMIAWTDGGKSNWTKVGVDFAFNEYGVRTPDSGMRYRTFHLTNGLSADQGYMFHHRLVSDVIYRDGKYYALVQQWYDATPYAPEVTIDDINEYTNILPAMKPVTTSLVHLDTVSPYPSRVARPVAYVDAGVGQHTEPSDSMLSSHRVSLSLDLDGNDLWFGNRVAFSVPDMSMWLGDAGGAIGFRSCLAESPTSAGVRLYKVGDATSVNVESIGDGLIATSAMPLWLDGDTVSELAPLDSPEIVSILDSYHDGVTEPWQETAFDEMESVTPIRWRKFVVVAGYTDKRGNIHRSAPSATVYSNQLTDADIPAADPFYPDPYPGEEVTVTFTAPSTIVSGQGPYFVELYVSKTVDDDPQFVASKSINTGSGSIADYQIVTQLTRIQPRSQPAWPAGHRTTQPRSSKTVYTSGGMLAADPWPAFTLSVATSTRLWVIDAINKGRVIPSKLFEDFIGPEYNPTLSVNLGDERNLTAIGKLDDKVVVFEPNDIHVIYGDGPDNRGQGQDFAVHYIATDVGCEDQESVIETPAGLIFYSKPRGFYLLDRNLQVQFIGDGIEDVARDIDVVSATLVPQWAEVRFLVDRGPLTPREEVIIPDQIGPAPGIAVFTTPGLDRPTWPTFNNGLPEESCLVFNYEKMQWSIYSNYSGRASTIYQNKYTQLLPDWSVWQEATDEGRDPDGTNRTLLRTPWIRLSDQVQDFGRLWKVTFLGRYLSSLQNSSDIVGDPLNTLEGGDVMVRAWFDYESHTLPAQEKLYRFQDFGFDPFNNTRLRAERFQFEWTPQRGRCQAVKFEIEEVNSTGTWEGQTYHLGRGFEIVSADFDIGLSPMRSLIPQGSKK